MSTTTISVRIDKNVKEEADKLFDELGLNLSNAINIFLRQAVRRQKIPFEIENEPRFNETTKNALDEKPNENIYYTLEALFEAMDAEVKNV